MLTDAGLELADISDDVRRRTAWIATAEVGKVDGLITDETERKVRFLEVGSGGFLGLGEKRQLVPVEAITGVDEDAVRTSAERHRLRAVYDPEVVPERRYYEGVYGYYG